MAGLDGQRPGGGENFLKFCEEFPAVREGPRALAEGFGRKTGLFAHGPEFVETAAAGPFAHFPVKAGALRTDFPHRAEDKDPRSRSLGRHAHRSAHAVGIRIVRVVDQREGAESRSGAPSGERLEGFEPEPEEEEDPDAPKRIKVTLAGRPNAGKSTLINALIGEERLIAFDMPGTTRDAIKVDFEYEGRPYELVDTAGLRKKGKVFEAIEKFSVVKTLQAIDDSNVVILVIDAKSGIADHDAHIAGYVLDSGRALVVAVNKWDLLDSYEREMFSGELERRLHFLRWARMIRISALKRNGLNHLMKAVDEAHAAAYRKIPTSKLTRALLEAVERQQPPRARGGRPKPRFAHQGGSNPPVIVIHGNALEDIGESYRRYLESFFREKFNLAGTPLRIEFRTKENPFVKEEKR